jgi:hypothetical protein
MYITENQNIGESVLFLLSARTTLAEMVQDSGHKSADVMINFLMNEASDYEIISLLVTGALPSEKYDQVAESYLFSILKEQVLRQSETITEMMGQASFNDFLSKVDSVYPVMSTAAPMLEFFAPQNPQIAGAMILAEADPGADVYRNIAKAATKKFAKYGQHGQKAHDLPGNIPSTSAPRNVELAKGGPLAGRPDISGGAGEAGGWVTRLKGHAYDIKAGAEKALADVKAGVQSAADVVSKFAKTPAGHAVGGAALAALLAYAAAKTYKRFFSKAAGACRGMSGGAKTDCMNKFRGRALMAQAADLQKGMASCAKAKNPTACKSAVGGKIERLKARAARLAG